jgi:RNA polymerase primary sigma factor
MNIALAERELDDLEVIEEPDAEPDLQTDSRDSLEESTASDHSLHQYMREVNALPLLRHEETMGLFQALEERQQGLDALESDGGKNREERRRVLEREVGDIKQKLITSNLRLVVFLANRFQGRGVSIQDLVQEGNIGLIRAIDKFDYRLGYRFSTYATWWIRQGMLRTIQQQGRLIRIPTHMLEKYQRFLRETRQAPVRPDGEDDALLPEKASTSVHPEMVFLMEVMRDPLSLDAPMTDDGLDLQEVTRDENQIAPEDRVIDQDLKVKLRTAMTTLPLREEVILRLRYGIDLPSAHTLEEVGQLFSLTKERIRQIESRALRRLNQWQAA